MPSSGLHDTVSFLLNDLCADYLLPLKSGFQKGGLAIPFHKFAIRVLPARKKLKVLYRYRFRQIVLEA